MSRRAGSSGENEEDGAAARARRNRSEHKTSRYQCPADFVSLSHKPCSGVLTDNLNQHHQLWLIKTPANFNPQRFRGLQVPLSGLHTLQVPAAEGRSRSRDDHQTYSVLASVHGASELRLLTSDKRFGATSLGPAFCGLLNVCESYGVGSADQSPQVVPAAPAPTMPPGLKQRFHPFGSKTPTLAESAAGRPPSLTLRPPVMKRFLGGTRPEEEVEEEGRKRKKKKKKEKQIKTEPLEEEEALVPVKTEPAFVLHAETTTELFPGPEGDASEKKKKKKKKEKQIKTEPLEEEEALVRVKTEPAFALQGETTTERFPGPEGDASEKKKKKKDRDGEKVEERVEPGVRVKEEVVVKCEPVDMSYGNVVEALVEPGQMCESPTGGANTPPVPSRGAGGGGCGTF